MSEQTAIASMLGLDSPTYINTKDRLEDKTVMASTLVTMVPASFGSGNIGRLAVTIVANRLLAHGADPRYISATLTIDIDTPPELIDAVTAGLRDAAVDAEMEWATVESAIKPVGPATGIAVSAFGVGSHRVRVTSDFRCPRPGDAIIVTGEIGATGAAINGQMRGVEVLTRSDGTVLTDIMREVYVHDPDLSAVIYPIEGVRETLVATGAKFTIDDEAVPVDGAVAAACKIMDIDVLDMPTAGAMILCVSQADVNKVLAAVRRFPAGVRATVIGKIEG